LLLETERQMVVIEDREMDAVHVRDVAVRRFLASQPWWGDRLRQEEGEVSG
jgi:hypothetical protein